MGQVNTIHIYADGSCLRNGKPDAIMGGGAVVFIESGVYSLAQRFPGEATNQKAELLSAAVALEYVTPYAQDKKVVLVVDSEYVYGFLAKRYKARANKEEVERLIVAALGILNLHVAWVRGHADSYINEMADDLATLSLDLEPDDQRVNRFTSLASDKVLLHLDSNLEMVRVDLAHTNKRLLL